MGTSASYRSPNTTKWNAVRTALGVQQVSPARAAAEIWSAADAEPLLSAEVSEYYKAWLRASATLTESSFESPARALRQLLDEARHASLAKGSSALTAAAERALLEACRSAAVESGSFIEAEPESIRAAWRSLADVPRVELTASFVAILVKQVTEFYTARDLARFLGSDVLPNAEALNRRLNELVAGAHELVKGAEISSQLSERQRPAQMWHKAIAAAVFALRKPALGG